MALPSQLFRFTRLPYAKAFVEAGAVSFGAAIGYNDTRLTDAQRDNEQLRGSSPDPGRHQLLVSAGENDPKALTGIFDLKISYDIRDNRGQPLTYYVLSCSLTDDDRLFDDFKADCCVSIKDAAEFYRRVEDTLAREMPNWSGLAAAVGYYRPNDVFVAERTLDLLFAKEAKYDSQQEFRFILIPPEDHGPCERITLQVGPLNDICTLRSK